MISLQNEDEAANMQNRSCAYPENNANLPTEYILFCKKINSITNTDEITIKISEYISFCSQTCIIAINDISYTGKMDCIQQINNAIIEEVRRLVQKIIRLLRKKNKKLQIACQGLCFNNYNVNNLPDTSSLRENLLIHLQKAHFSTFNKNIPFQDPLFSSDNLLQGSFLAYKARVKRELEQYFESQQRYLIGFFEDLSKSYKEKAWEACAVQFNENIQNRESAYSEITYVSEETEKNTIVAAPTPHSLLDSDFFPDPSLIPTNRIFPVMVLATMSSGKSTLINALLGRDILPAQNQACTAKVYSILDDDTISNPVLYITDQDGQSKKISSEIVQTIIHANEEPTVEHILLIDQIHSLLNTNRLSLLIDTPGPNNATDKYHAQIAHKTLSKIHGGVLLYLINATQIGITDDKELLKIVREHTKNNPQLKVLALINKIDALDPEKEPIYDIVANVKNYLEMNDLCCADVVPISALAAKLFKQVWAGKKDFTRLQRQQIEYFLQVFSDNTPILSTYAWLSHGKDPRSIIEPFGYSIAQIENALLHTGIMWVEQYIQREQIICDK